ncbi:MAG: hypothetical protein ABFS21_03770 [Actinomycetota bacterium]
MGFESQYVTRFEERQRLLFELHAEGTAHDLRPLEAAIYDLCCAYADSTNSDRRSRVLQEVATRGRVDFHPAVTRLRDRLDDPSNYRSSDDDGWSALGAAMEGDLIELIEARNRLAVDQGFASYGHLAMWHEGLDIAAVRRFIADRRDDALPAARRTIDQEGMTLKSWFDDLERLGGPGPDDVADSAEAMTHHLGLSDLAHRLSWIVKDQPIYGIAFGVSVPGDVRILLGRSGSLTAQATAFHELGHALHHAANRGTGIFRTWDVTSDESMAVVVERLATRSLHNDERRRIATVETLEAARQATSFLFEAAVDAEPARAREFFVQWYGPLAPFENPAMWARDSFRSIDPFHIHAYVIGNVVADATLAFLSDRYPGEPTAWGPWLVEHYFAEGRGRSLSDRLDDLEEHRPSVLNPLFLER